MQLFVYLLVVFSSMSLAPRQALAERGDGGCTGTLRLMTSACRSGSSSSSSCQVPNGHGVPARSSAGFSYCQLRSCNAGFQKRGETCVPRFQTRSCTVANGRGSQNSYGGVWSSCQIQSCNAGFVLFRGVCQRPLRSTAAKCGLFAGRGSIKVVSGNQSFCKVESCSAGFEIRGNSCVRKNAPNAKVNLVIIRKSDGSGNAKWTNAYIRKMIDQMTDSTQGNVRFYLGWVKYWNNSADFANPTQDGVKMKFVNFKEFGAITAVVTQPATTDSSGTALGIKYNYEPLMMIRSRLNDGSAQDSQIAGAVLLHELGHNMGMRHNYDKSVHMDNHYYLTPGVLKNYVLGLNRCTTPNEVCVRNYSKFGNPYSSSPFSWNSND